MKIDKFAINNINKRNILNIVRNVDQISRVELAQLTNLSLPTVMKLVDEFIDRGIILDLGSGISTGGKPPKLLRFNYQSHYIIGVDINSNRIDVILMDIAAKIVCAKIRDIGKYCSGEQVIQYTKDLIHSVMETSGISKEIILGIGIGIEGIIDNKAGVLQEFPAFGWSDIDVGTPIREAFELPVIVDNDTRAMAMGEKLVGIACETENFICINMNYNVDAALVLDGSLHYGGGFSPGAVGHTTVERNGRLCECGRKGCLNTAAAPRAIEQRAKELISSLKRGQTSQILDMVYGHADWINIYTVMDAAENGDEIAIKLIREMADSMSMAIMNMICLLNPEMIIIEGKIARNSHIFRKELKSSLMREREKIFHNTFRLELSSLGKHLCAIGAASFILSGFIESGGVEPQ